MGHQKPRNTNDNKQNDQCVQKRPQVIGKPLRL